MDSSKARAEVLAKFTTGAIDLQEELDNILRVLKFQRQALTNKMTEGFGYKQMELNPDDAKLANQLTLSYQKAVDSKVKLDKHLRERAEELTPAEELESVKRYVQNLDSTIRRKMLIELLEFHNANTINSQWMITTEKKE